jgi:hypothetical protein
MPMTANRALTNTAAKIAASALPPAPSTSARANWAEPEKTTPEATIGATKPQSSERASTPNETAKTNVGNANPTPALSPLRNFARRSACAGATDTGSATDQFWTPG